ncbi:MAG: TatD family hydrolase [Lachnospiraceae bacterium]|nr:TatD family hydrolase [Lachnospiraceae bacterium]
MIFDTHAHYDDDAFENDREEMISRLKPAGIVHAIDVGASKKSMPLVKEIADTHDFIYGALGMHPDEVGDIDDDLLAFMRKGLEDPKIVAVGEIGLDYHWDVMPHEVQIHWFMEQTKMAWEADLPILIHSRSAAADTMDTIQKMYGPGAPGAGIKRKGIVHCYSYSLEQAKIYTEMGFYLGIGGTVTFKNAKKLKKVVTEIPLDHLLLETDCPYMAPEPHRGSRNSSLNLPYVVAEIARLKGISAREVEDVTYMNAMELFQIPE